MLRADLARSARLFLAQERCIEPSASARPVHDARVELRRLRSDLRTFRTYFAPEWQSAALAEISWYQTLLGDVRDIDVAIGRVLKLEECASDGPGAAVITTLLAKDRASALRNLARARSSERYSSTMRYLDELASDAPLRRRASVDARAALPPILARVRRNFRETVRFARKEPTELALHNVRLRAKELRFASELATGVFDDAAALAKACARVQRHLGRHRDAIAAETWLRAAAAMAPDSALLAGRLAAGQEQLAAELIATWRDEAKQVNRAWRSFDRAHPR